MNAMVVTARAASSSPVHLGKQAGTEAFRISAEIVPARIVQLPQLRENIRKEVADLFWRTFDGGSLSAKCENAARMIAGVSADTFARIASKETDKIDHALVRVMLALHHHKHGIPFQMTALAVRAGAA